MPATRFPLPDAGNTKIAASVAVMMPRMTASTLLEHGGRLRRAAAEHGIALGDWLDLSTGVHPLGWPVPALPAEVWRRLPEDDDGLEAAAAQYCGHPAPLPVAGSQAAIQLLPQLLPRATVACLAPLYNEHPHAWAQAGHRVRRLPAGQLQRALGAAVPYVLLCNPNNPTAHLLGRDELLAAAARLHARGGWLIVDEAFIDATPQHSVAAEAGSAAAPNLIVLRSIGKFFGLAGIRLGFVCAAAELRQKLAVALGPWSVAGPARAAARLALADRTWQSAQRSALAAASARLQTLLAPLGEVRATALFATVATPHAARWHGELARRAILTRLFADPALLRFGLPADAAGWQRLADALAPLTPDPEPRP